MQQIGHSNVGPVYDALDFVRLIDGPGRADRERRGDGGRRMVLEEGEEGGDSPASR